MYGMTICPLWEHIEDHYLRSSPPADLIVPQKKDGCGGGLQVGRDQLHTPALTVIGLLSWLFPFFVNGDNPGGAEGDSQSITVCSLDDIHAASRADGKARQHPTCSYYCYKAVPTIGLRTMLHAAE
jgi:hypothetical protein